MAEVNEPHKLQRRVNQDLLRPFVIATTKRALCRRAAQSAPTKPMTRRQKERVTTVRRSSRRTARGPSARVSAAALVSRRRLSAIPIPIADPTPDDQRVLVQESDRRWRRPAGDEAALIDGHCPSSLRRASGKALGSGYGALSSPSLQAHQGRHRTPGDHGVAK